MEKKYKFSSGLFYPSDIEYKNIPPDAIDVNEEEYQKAMNRPLGYGFVVNDNGTVSLLPPQEPTPEELILVAEAEKKRLKVIADGEIEWRKYSVEKGKATEEEQEDLISWEDYRLNLMRVKTDKPEWPEMPK